MSRPLFPLALILSLLSLSLFAPTPLPAQAASVWRDLGTLESLTTGSESELTIRNSTWPRLHTFQLIPLSTPSACTATVEVSLDGDNWADLTGDQTCTSIVYVSVVNEMARYARPILKTALTGTAASVVKTLVQTLDETDFATHASWDTTDGFDDTGGNAVFAVPETLDEVDFATHVNWDVTAGFVDSGGNAVFSVPETLDEVDFATTVNWTPADDWACGSGVCTYADSSNAGTLTQASGDFVVAATGGGVYDFTYTIAAFTGDGTCDVTTAFAATTTALTIANGTQTTVITATGSPGDFVISCISGSGGFTIDNVTLKNNTHTATLTQVSGSFVAAATASSVYDFTYTGSSTTGTPVCAITTAFAATSTGLTESDATTTTVFTSASSPGDFVISCTATDILDTITWDDFTLKNNTHAGTLTQADGNYANALVATQLYTIIYTGSSTTGTPVCEVTSGFAATLSMTESDATTVQEGTSTATITDDFVITCTATDILDTITFDDISWFEQNCTNETPIEVTTAAVHGRATGDKVTIASAVGNTNCNVTANLVTVLTTTVFTLDATTGNAPWQSGGTVTTAPGVRFIYLGGE